MYQNPDVAVNDGRGSLNLPHDKDELQELITAAIAGLRNQSADERRAMAYSRHEVAELDSLDRLKLLRNATIEGLGRYFSLHKAADPAPGVYALIVQLSDNGKYGASYLQIPRFAKFLSRDPRTISRALARLCKDGLLLEELRPGRSSLYWPVFSREVDIGAHPTWFINAVAPAPTGKAGRPRNTPVNECQGYPETPPTAGVQGIKNTPVTGSEIPLTPCMRYESTKDSPLRDARTKGCESNSANGSLSPRIKGDLFPDTPKTPVECWFTADGKLHASDALRADLMREHGCGEGALNEAIAAATGRVPLTVGPVTRLTKLRGRVATHFAEQRQRAANYEKAIATRQNGSRSLFKTGETSRIYTGAKQQQTAAPDISPKEWPPARWHDAYIDHFRLERRWPSELGPPPSAPDHWGPRDVLQPFLREMTP